MKSLYTLVTLSMMNLTSCGVDDSKGGSSDAAESSSTISLALESEADLPSCNLEIINQLVYLKTEKKFKTCNGGAWEDITVVGETGPAGVAGAAGASGLEIKDVWNYGVDTYQGATDLDTEASTFDVWVGNLELVTFSNGDAHITVTGTFSALRSYGGTDYIDYSDFTHSFFLKSSDSEQTVKFKLNSYSDAVSQYKVTLGDTPAFRGTTSTDGSLSNESYVDFTLLKQQ